MATRLSAYIEIDGQEIRRRRLARRMKVSELAASAKIHKSHIYKLEGRQQTRVSVGTLRGLEDVLGALEEPAEAAASTS